ncbi:MAG: deoxyribodipyrimidine photo-lyase, partial [Ignavibacteria bacterium]|nr:deoxyribodipyrimidine photo-lyase [Ignavibacteria bacterium]
MKDSKYIYGAVIYWMQREQRVHDNWALLYAQQKALETNSNLYVVFNLVSTFLQATIRQYDFMLKGLQQVEEELKKFNIPFVLLSGNAEDEIPKYVGNVDAKLLVTDFNPLKIVKQWKKSITEKINIPFHEIDAHNIIPYHQASDKLEFAAYTIRPKIHRLLPEFLEEFPKLKQMKQNIKLENINWDSVYKTLKVDKAVKPIDWLKPGEKSANKVLEEFINYKFQNYSIDRNDPTKDAQSNLSPYLHFGQIAPQRVALAVQPIFENAESQKSFLEELIVRRELSDNFCYYNQNYDSFDGFPQWAKDSLNLHRKDKREYIYSVEEFELAKTHDDLWNASQMEMVKKGKMHGYM